MTLPPRSVLIAFTSVSATLLTVARDSAHSRSTTSYYLPDAAASSEVTVVPSSESTEAAITILTQAVAEKDDESGTRSCQIYAFTPSFVAVRRDEPTLFSFRNFQADDDHDFMLVGPDSKVLMFVTLPSLKETSYLFTFHKEGLFSFHCTMHQPEMNGQILVLPRLKASMRSPKPLVRPHLSLRRNQWLVPPYPPSWANRSARGLPRLGCRAGSRRDVGLLPNPQMGCR